MPKKVFNPDDFVVSESGNWNVASKFADFKIFKPLYFLDEYTNIAETGYTDFFEELAGVDSATPITIKRFRALQWLLSGLLLIIDNSYFAIKYEKDKNKFENYYKILEEMQKISKTLLIVKNNQKTKSQQYILKEEQFTVLFKQIMKIKREVNTILNKSHLIFTDKEDFDPIKFKEEIKRRMINKG